MNIRAAVLAELRRCELRDREPTIAQLAVAIGHPYAGATVSCKLRELRLKRYGGHLILCRRCRAEERGPGKIYRYRLNSRVTGWAKPLRARSWHFWTGSSLSVCRVWLREGFELSDKPVGDRLCLQCLRYVHGSGIPSNAK